jgi:hypothetical protein
MSWDEGVERVFEDVPALFSGCGDDGAEGCKGFGAGLGAETARDFHFDLHHADVLLGLIVGERHGEVR